MILSREQINRYSRHIVIPEISGSGQKKITESIAWVIAEDVEQASILVYYLAASGVGRICIHIDKGMSHQALINNVKDLNPDLSLEFTTIPSSPEKYSENVIRIIIGRVSFIVDILSRCSCTNKANRFIPTIIAVGGGWRGAVQTFIEQSDYDAFIEKLMRKDILMMKPEGAIDNMLSISAAGTIAAIEHIKCILNLGKTLTKGLFYNLLQMKFENKDIYEVLFGNQIFGTSVSYNLAKLADARVLIVGSGGLGSPAAYALATAGVGTIGLVDYDSVDISNLNRQIMHATSRIGMPKVKSAEIFLKKINPNIVLNLYETSFSRDNAVDLIKEYDIIIDGLDNLPTRYLLNDACHFTGKILVTAGVLGFSGVAAALIPDSGPCYRCIYPEASTKGTTVPSCAETGVLGPVPGLMGLIEATEAIKCLTGTGALLNNRLLLFDALEMDFYISDHPRDPGCALCGSEPTITGLSDYKFVCKSKNNSTM